MSLSDRRKFLTLLATPLALSACGFTPIYSDGSAADKMHGRLALGEFHGLNGFQMREVLETNLGRENNATHVLNVTLSISRKGLAITTDGSITRYNLAGKASFDVQRISGGTVYRNSVTAFTAFNATASAYATRVAEQDAYRRVIENLGDKITTNLAISAKDWLM